MRFFSVALFFLVPVASQICKNSMYSNDTEVLQAHNSMLNSYFVRCFRDDSCSVEVGEVISSSFEDYTNLGNEVQFVSQYSNTCGEFNYSVCQLNIDYMIFRPNLFQYIKEVNKPFCLPNSCAENQVHSLDIYVPSCSAAGENCTKALIGVACPDDRVLDVTGNCTEDLPGSFSRLNFLRSSIYAAMESRCASGNLNPNEYCIQERSEASVSSTSDFTDVIEEAQTPYVSFAQTCLKEEGLYCEVSYTLNSVGIEGNYFTDARTSMPICLPNDCSNKGNTEKAAVIKDIILNQLSTASPRVQSQPGAAQTESICASDPSQCTVDIHSFSCDNEKVPEETCPLGNGNAMYEIESVSTEATAVFDGYFQECTDECFGMYFPGYSDTVRDFSSIDTQRFEDMCASNGRDICTADIVYDINNAQRKAVITEKNKPFCFPPSCGEGDIELMNPYLSLCNLGGCTATIKQISCPEGRNYQNTGTCENDVTRPFRLIAAERAVRGAMDVACVQTTGAGDTPVANEDCKTGNVKAQLNYDLQFTEYTTDSLTRLTQNCLQEGGVICKVSYDNTASGLTVDVYDYREDVTVCIPKLCYQNETEQELAVKDIIYNEIAIGNEAYVLQGGETGIELSFCSMDNSACSLNIYSLICEDSS